MGLFGLTVFAAEQRIKEIGIRKVLGAGVLSIITLLSKDLLKLVFVGISLAIPASAYLIYRWLQNYSYRIGLEWWIFVIISIIIIMVAILTISFQAVKTAAMNPAKSLRSE